MGEGLRWEVQEIEHIRVQSCGKPEEKHERWSDGDRANCTGLSSKDVRSLNQLKRGSNNNREERQST
jgi:hypothetical protein